MPTPRQHLASSVVQGKLYAIGGRVSGVATNLNVNEEYDHSTDSWSARAPMPTNRSGIAAAVEGDRIFVLGGETPFGTLNTNEEYNPLGDTWTKAPPMPASKHAISAVSADGRVYVFGGGLSAGVSVTPETVILVSKNQR